MDSNTPDHFFRAAVKVLLGALALMLLAIMALLLQTPLGGVWSRILDALFGFNSVQGLWYVTRAAGIVAYLLLWLSTVWGLAVSNKIFDPVLQRAFTLRRAPIPIAVRHRICRSACCRFAGRPLSAVFGGADFDTLCFTVSPGVGGNRRYWALSHAARLGDVLYSTADWHSDISRCPLSKLLAFAAAALHGWFSGADTPLVATQLMYAGTALSVVFLTVYLIVITRLNRSNFSRERNRADSSGSAEDTLSQRAFL